MNFLKRLKTEYLTAIKLALSSMKTNKVRALLSILGIMIGVVALIIVVSAGTGARNLILGQIEAFGSDFVEIEVKVPDVAQTSAQNATGSGQITTFKLKEAEKIAKNDNVQDWYALVLGQELASYRDENSTLLLMGTTVGVTKVDEQFKLAEGRMFTQGEDEGLAQVVVLGSKIKKDIFGAQDAIGKSIKIQNKNFKVIGVLKERGSVAFFDFDTLAYIPVTTLQKKVQGIDHIQAAFYKLKNVDLTEKTVAEMKYEMRELHDISNPEKDDFAITSMGEATDIVGNVFGVINILLIGLVFISLLVGGVGVMNVMYVAVSERTFEIGLRKAVGASEADIRYQFLFEAIVITLAGAIVGIFIGSLFMFMVSKIAANFGYDIGLAISLQSIILASLFSIFTGVVFGYYPAQKAARLTPIEALRK